MTIGLDGNLSRRTIMDEIDDIRRQKRWAQVAAALAIAGCVGGFVKLTAARHEIARMLRECSCRVADAAVTDLGPCSGLKSASGEGFDLPPRSKCSLTAVVAR